jgi:ATP-independent RNA helicase DbpA
MSKNSFDNLIIGPEVVEHLNHIGYTEMTTIQAESLPHILEGKDVLAKSKTGSGKTAAFGLGVLKNIHLEDMFPQALILCPTRELAEQVTMEIRKLGRYLQNLKILSVCGGTSEEHQVKSLSYGVHIIVGTPGRVMRLIKNKALHVDEVSTFVLDEADRMLDMGFFDDIDWIESQTLERKQTLLFSATYTDEIIDLSKDFQNDAIEVSVDETHEDEVIKEYFFSAIKGQQQEALVQLFKHFQPQSSLIFCKTKIQCEEIAKVLNKAGIKSLAIHGDLDQNKRTNVLTQFENNSSLTLVATDVAARGLDITNLDAVINYGLPNNPETYTHRIGRTGRAGKKGIALNIFTERDHYKLDEIEEGLNQTIEILDLENFPESELTISPLTTTYFISGGRKDKIRPGDILGALVGEVGVDGKAVGNINIQNVFSYVAINSEVRNDYLSGFQKIKIKKRNYKIGPA